MLEFVSLRSTLYQAAAAAMCVGLLVGCKADAPGSKTVVPVTNPDLAPPRAETATETPLNTVVIQGTAVSRKVLLRADGSGLSQVVATDFDGNFYAEFPLDDEASDTYAVYAVDDDGEISRPTTLTVAQVAVAPEPEMTACNAGPMCKEEEICEGDLDADCDGNKGECDTDCNGCSDDYFEPNDLPSSPPQVTPGTYALDICPCNMDYFTIPMVKNQTYTVTVSFDNSAIDLDLYLWTQANAEAQNTTYAAKSVSTAAVEKFTYKATADGNYVLWVRVYDGALGNEAPYTLKIQ